MASQGNTPFGQPHLVYAIPASNQRRSGVEIARQNKSSFLGLAITQVVLGVFCIGLGISALSECNDDFRCYYELTEAAAGIWGGASVIVFGSFGLILVCEPTPCKITTNLVMSILGFLTSVTMMAIEIAATIETRYEDDLVILHSAIATFSFALFILFISSALYSGTAHGCCAGSSQEETGIQMVVHSGTTGTSGMMAVSNGQLVVMQGESSETSHTMMTSPATDSPPRYEEALSSSTGGGGVVNQDFRDDLPNKF